MKFNILDMSLSSLSEMFKDIGEPLFRAKQVFRWLHNAKVDKFDEMLNVAKSLRYKLNDIASITALTLLTEQCATDGTRKWLFDVGNGNSIETVLIPEVSRSTICISSQVGCALDCKFCVTGHQGFNRNLRAWEIVGQLRWAEKYMSQFNDPPITNVVMMGMGEPLANYKNVIEAMKIMLDDNGYNISRHKLTLSTSGMVPALNRLANDCRVALAISLHASNDEIRDKIVPINRKYKIQELLSAAKNYIANTTDAVTFEYIMLKDVNDSIRCAKELIQLVNGIKCKFNLIPFNNFYNSGFETSLKEVILEFQQTLRSAGYICTIRKTRGDDIDAACGQLAGLVLDKTTRQSQYKSIQIHEV